MASKAPSYYLSHMAHFQLIPFDHLKGFIFLEDIENLGKNFPQAQFFPQPT